MGKVSRRPGRAARRIEWREPARIFRDGANEVMVRGPLARDPFDALAVATMLESLTVHVLSAACCTEFVDQVGNLVAVTGPIAGDREATADALEGIARALRADHEKPLRGNRRLSDIDAECDEEPCMPPLREAA